MDELKQALQNELSHVKTVWFDQHDNWYLHKVPSALREMSREEILGEKPNETPEEKPEGKKRNKK